MRNRVVAQVAKPMMMLGLAVAAAIPGCLAAQGSDAPVPDGYKYYWPGECVEAIKRSDAFYWRARIDTAEYSVAADTVLDDTKRVARECVAVFEGKTLVPHDLIPLARVYLALGDDARARDIVERRLAESDAKSPGTRAWLLAQVVGLYVNASPARVDDALPYAEQVKGLRGDSTAVGQLLASYYLASHYRERSNDAAMSDAANAVIAAGKEMSRNERVEFVRQIGLAYRMLAERAGTETGDSIKPLEVLSRATADIGQVQGGQQIVQSAQAVFRLYGKPASRIQADVWMSADSVHPYPGKATLMNFMPSRYNVPAMGRVARAIGDSVGVVSIVGTQGYFRGRGPLTPEFEMQDLQEYYSSELRLPGGLALTTTSFNTLPDGRKVPEPSMNGRAYSTRSGTSFVVVDKQGIIRRVWTYWGRWYEPQIRETLEKYSR